MLPCANLQTAGIWVNVTPHLRGGHGARLAKNPFYNLETIGLFGFRRRFPPGRLRVTAADIARSPTGTRCNEKDKFLKLNDYCSGFEICLAARYLKFLRTIGEGEHG
jgi:hypothetical protein